MIFDIMQIYFGLAFSNALGFCLGPRAKMCLCLGTLPDTQPPITSEVAPSIRSIRPSTIPTDENHCWPHKLPVLTDFLIMTTTLTNVVRHLLLELSKKYQEYAIAHSYSNKYDVRLR